MHLAGLKFKKTIKFMTLTVYSRYAANNQGATTKIQETAFKNIQNNAFVLQPENMLYSMLKSNELEMRHEAIKRILANS